MIFRPEHTVIVKVLAAMNADLLLDCRCYFGGGTAIVLGNGEYRLSLDIDFLCSDIDGYRHLRNAIVRHGAGALFGPEVKTLREFRTDQYGLRSVLALEDQAIKFEIVRESRICLDGALDPALAVPLLAIEDQFAEKLLANADLYADRAVAYRDAVDLGILVQRHGSIPAASVAKVEAAYGEDVTRKLSGVFEMLSSAAEIRRAGDTLAMAPDAVYRAADALRTAALSAWPSLVLMHPAASRQGLEQT